jgi:hypothetical protein
MRIQDTPRIPAFWPGDMRQGKRRRTLPTGVSSQNRIQRQTVIVLPTPASKRDVPYYPRHLIRLRARSGAFEISTMQID